MKKNNLLPIEFSAEELSTINNALLMLEQTFAGKLIAGDAFDLSLGKDAGLENLSLMPSDCGTILLKSLPPFTNMDQWDQDERARMQLSPITMRLKTIAQQVIFTNRAVLQRCWNSTNSYYE